jgi:hypothetical protein
LLSDNSPFFFAGLLWKTVPCHGWKCRRATWATSWCFAADRIGYAGKPVSSLSSVTAAGQEIGLEAIGFFAGQTGSSLYRVHFGASAKFWSDQLRALILRGCAPDNFPACLVVPRLGQIHRAGSQSRGGLAGARRRYTGHGADAFYRKAWLRTF